MMNNKKVVGAAMACMLIAGSFAAFAQAAEEKTVRTLPAASLKPVIAGKTISARVAGYGWGEEDDVSSLNLDLTITDQASIAASDAESLAEGDELIIGYDVYTVKSVEQTDDGITVTPDDEWYSPVTLVKSDDGSYLAENEDGPLLVDSFSFQPQIAQEVAYINEAGEELAKEDLLKDLVDEALDTYSIVPVVTFDEDGYLTGIDFSGQEQ